MIEKKIMNILFVEDEPSHAEITLRNFEEAPYEFSVMHVTDGREALDYLSTLDPLHKNQPDLMLMDLRLPRVNGLELLEILREMPQYKNLPVIVLSTSYAEDDVAKAYQYHVNSYLVKPLNFNAFTEMIRSLCEYWIRWNHWPLKQISEK